MSDVTLLVTSATISPLGISTVEVTLTNADETDMLKEINIDDAIEHYGSNTLLDRIGQEEAIKYFGIEVKD